MWGVATCCWFLANHYLSAVVSFPIITTVSYRSQKSAHLFVFFREDFVQIICVWFIPGSWIDCSSLGCCRVQRSEGKYLCVWCKSSVPAVYCFYLFVLNFLSSPLSLPQGWRNYIVLIVAFCLVLSGALLTAFSKL